MSTILSIVFALIMVTLVGLIVALFKSLKKTIYSYENVGIIGAIGFVIVSLCVLVMYLIRHVTMGSIPEARSFFISILHFPEKFCFYALILIFALSGAIFVSNIALIWHEGFRVTNLLGALLGVLYIGGTLLMFVLSDMGYEYILEPKGLTNSPVYMSVHTGIGIFFMIVVCYFDCILVGTAIMGYVAVKHEPHYDKDFIIILGCSISKAGGLLPLIKARTNAAIRFAWDQERRVGKKVCYVPSGGQGADEIMSEASAMEMYLLSHGAENDEVFPEKSSTDTYENMLFSKRLILEKEPDAHIAFATTNYHVFRSGILARKAGIEAEGVPSDTKWYFWPNGFVREFFGILALNKRAHIIIGVISAIIGISLGFIEYFVLM